MHYHIRWSSGKVDWERYNSRAEAEARARQLIPKKGPTQLRNSVTPLVHVAGMPSRLRWVVVKDSSGMPG